MCIYLTTHHVVKDPMHAYIILFFCETKRSFINESDYNQHAATLARNLAGCSPKRQPEHLKLDEHTCITRAHRMHYCESKIVPLSWHELLLGLE
jgi:hypothetical protein